MLPPGYRWAGADWKAATWRKVGAARQVLMMGYSVVMTDIDVMWLRDPLPYVLNVSSRADMLISLDAHHSSKAPGDTGVCCRRALGQDSCAACSSAALARRMQG